MVANTNFALNAQKTRSVTMNSHYTQQVVQIAVEIDQAVRNLEQGVAMGNISTDDEMKVRRRLNTLIDTIKSELSEVKKPINRTRRRRNKNSGANAARPGNFNTKTSSSTDKKSAEPPVSKTTEKTTSKKTAKKKASKAVSKKKSTAKRTESTAEKAA